MALEKEIWCEDLKV